MKKIIIVSLCLIFANTIKGQDISFPTDSASWVYNYSSTGNKDYIPPSNLLGDTLINGLIFQKIGSSIVTVGYSHVNGQKVFYLSNKSLYISAPNFIDTNIRLLYDFNIEIGDTLKYPNRIDSDTREDSMLFILSSIDTINTNIDSRKKYNFRVLFLDRNGGFLESFTYWIEGIGEYHSLDFIRNQYYILGGEGNSSLRCFFHKNQQVYGTYCTINVDEFKVKDELLVYPNPFTERFSITIPGDFSPYGYSIYDVNGKIIKSESISEFEKTISINANNFKKGTFFIVLSDGKGNMLKKVVVKQ